MQTPLHPPPDSGFSILNQTLWHLRLTDRLRLNHISPDVTSPEEESCKGSISGATGELREVENGKRLILSALITCQLQRYDAL